MEVIRSKDLHQAGHVEEVHRSCKHQHVGLPHHIENQGHIVFLIVHTFEVMIGFVAGMAGNAQVDFVVFQNHSFAFCIGTGCTRKQLVD